MHARVNTFEGSPERADELERVVTERVVPSLTQMDGYRGMHALTERQGGKVLVVTIWDDEEAMRQNEGAVDQLFLESEEQETVAGAETFAVVTSEWMH
jgi:heme-degrading monooxygenase HmoA